MQWIENNFTIFLGPPASYAEVMSFEAMHYIRAKQFVFTM
jgi:hypothetical protein